MVTVQVVVTEGKETEFFHIGSIPMLLKTAVCHRDVWRLENKNSVSGTSPER